jgi:hypothetical protein
MPFERREMGVGGLHGLHTERRMTNKQPQTKYLIIGKHVKKFFYLSTLHFTCLPIICYSFAGKNRWEEFCRSRSDASEL